MTRVYLPILMCAACIAAVGAAAPSSEGAASPATAGVVVDRFLSATGPRLESYRARRTLWATSMGGRFEATVEAWTMLEGGGTFRFDVISERGSSLVREHVLLKALETERDTHNGGTASRIELTPDNYEFAAETGPAGATARLALRPRRRSPMLLNGTITVRWPDADLVRLEGSPSELPSWWTKRVDISQRYARVNRVRVPVELSSRSDIRIAGESSFLMTYEYVEINGQPVPR